MIYMFLSNNPLSGGINLSNLSCFMIGFEQCVDQKVTAYMSKLI